MPQGYTRLPDGRIRAWVRVSSKRDDFNALITRRFPADYRPADLRAWRLENRRRLQQRLELHRQKRAAVLGAAGGFRADAVAYLRAVQALTTYTERCRDISLWVEVFGDRPRAEIHAHEIRAVRDQWLLVGPRRVWRKVNGVGQWIDVPGPLSASTVNHRLRALSNLYTVLDGRHVRNPVHDVPDVAEPVPVPRGIGYPTIRLILAAMANQGRAVKGQKRGAESLAKVRARVMAWTGTEPTELGRITAPTVVEAIQSGVLFVPGRRKGGGAPGRLIPLNSDAIAALTDLVRLNGCGPFRGRVVLRAWQLACHKVLGRSLRIKDLRHSFVTSVVAATKSLETAQLLAGHTDARTTRRYAMAALLDTMRAGIDVTFPDTEKKPQ